MPTPPSALNQITCHVRHVRYSLPVLPCDRCQQRASRVWDASRTAVDLDLDQPVLLLVTVSVHHCPACRHYFRSQPPFLRAGTPYTNRVVSMAVQSVYRDGMAIRRVQQRLAQDCWVRPSEAMARVWCRRYARQLDFAADYQAWVVSTFSGVLCVDELYQGGLALLLAVDPAAPTGDRLVGYQLVRGTVRQEDVAAFLRRLQAAGIEPEEVITDQSPLYPAVLAAVWPQAAHQLCLFHVARHVLTAARLTTREIRAAVPVPPPLPPPLRPGSTPEHPGRPDLRGRPRSAPQAAPVPFDARAAARDAAHHTVRALRREGQSARAIARQTGFSRLTVQRWLAEPCPETAPTLEAAPMRPVPNTSPTASPPPGWASWDQVRQVREVLHAKRYYLLRRPDHRTAAGEQDLSALLASPVGAAVGVVRRFLACWYGLWRDELGRRRTPADARARFDAWRTDPAYAAWPALQRLLIRLDEAQFTRLSQFLHHPHWESTNDGAERAGRRFRHDQAPHFYFRTSATLDDAIVAHAFAQQAAQSAPPRRRAQRSTRGRLPRTHLLAA